MGIAVYSVRWLVFSSNTVLLLSQVWTGILLYIVVNGVFRTFAFVETLEILKDKLKPFLLSREIS